MDKDQTTQTTQAQTETAKQPTRRNKNSLLVYVAVMFAVAFLLVLFSFLTQQRDSNQTISTLSQTSATAVGRVQELEEAYTTLTKENQDLADQVEDLTQELEALQSQLDGLTQAKADLEQELAQAQTEKTETEDALNETNSALEALRQEQQTLTAQVETLNDSRTIDGLLEQGAAAALALDDAALEQALTELGTLIAQPDSAAFDTRQQTLYEQLQRRLTLSSSTEQG